VGIETEIGSDYYLWLAGKATEWFHGSNSYGITKPIRSN